jgi:hypothetical protein
MQIAERMKPLQANVFADMDQAKAKARAAGQTIIDLSLGSSDLPADAHVLRCDRSRPPRSLHPRLLSIFRDPEIFAKRRLTVVHPKIWRLGRFLKPKCYC